MGKGARIALWVAVAILIAAAFIWWQMRQLDRGLRTFHADNLQEILTDALSSAVLSPSVTTSVAASSPLLDKNSVSATAHQKYLLMVTWAHAAQMSNSVNDWGAFNGMTLSSASLRQIPWNMRVDGWKVPYCVSVQSARLVFMSSGGSGAVDCKALQQTAREALRLPEARLFRIGKLLVTVQQRSVGD